MSVCTELKDKSYDLSYNLMSGAGKVPITKSV